MFSWESVDEEMARMESEVEEWMGYSRKLEDECNELDIKVARLVELVKSCKNTLDTMGIENVLQEKLNSIMEVGNE